MTLRAPIGSWDEAIPLGNGMMGGLLWGEGRTLRLSLDRADLWDLRTPAIYLESDWNYATIQRLVKERNQKELVRRFDAPFEQIPYPTKLPGARLELTLPEGAELQQFSLDLGEGRGLAVFGGGSAETYFSATEMVAFVRLRGAAPAAFTLIAPAGLAKLGYDPAERGGDDSSAWLVQRTRQETSYAVHVAKRSVADTTEFAIAIASSGEGADPLAIARNRTASALIRGFDRALVPHRAWWQRFWAASSVSVPDAAIQSQYDLARYFYGSGARRGAPPIPLQGLWTADAGGLPPWKGDFHFDLNVQLTYWPYLQAGHFDEGAGYLDFMWALIPAHRAFATRFYNAPGIVVPGVMALDGQPLAGWGQYSLSPVQGAWVAQAFYLHWRYTADRRFLADRAYPYSALIADALVSLMRPDESGKLELPLSRSPEIHDNSLAAWMTPMTNYDLSLVRFLVTSLDEMAGVLGKTDEAAKWRGLLARMDDFAVDPATGALKVSPTEPLTASHRHLSHLMAIHPLGLVTVEGNDADRRAIAASLDQLEALGTKQWVGYSFAWAAAMEARAARPDKALPYLETYAKAFVLRNGFHANGDQTKSGYSNFTYRPFTLEGNFAAAQAVHEMLLQSWGGVVRVFPAVSSRWADVSFTDLRAEGGYRVSARRSAGGTVEVRITAGQSGTLRLRDPFGGRGATWTVGGRIVAPVRTGGVLEIALRAPDVLHGLASSR